jgi:hypothetical protein
VSSRVLATAFAAAAVVLTGVAVPAASAAAPAPPVIAILQEPDPLNVLHSDFRTRDGRDAVLPRGVRAVRVTLPARGDFDERMAAVAEGPLGAMKPDTLYYVAGTRLLIYNARDAAGRARTDLVTGDRLHSTGVVGAAIGRRNGTAPDALAVFVTGSGNGPWEWVASQPWIDVVSTSSYTTPQASTGAAGTGSRLCEGAAAVRRMTGAGRIVFSSSGNTTDQPEPFVSPNGLPEVFQVGGVDSAGRTWTPPRTEEEDPFYTAGNVVRPYETGELYSFPAAGPDSLDGTVHFGGTSGATPRTAGWAATLIAAARRATGGGAVGGALASGRRVARGPLADGKLTGAELGMLMRHVAVPAEAATPARYFVEGYGALNARAVAAAVAVLQGRAAEPARPDEDAASAATREARAALFNAARCAV